MSTSQRALALLAYLLLPIGWLAILLFGRRSRFAIFHMKQAVALVLFLATIAIGWAALAWLTAWASYLFVVGIAAFSLVMAAAIFGVIVWLLGMRNALRAQMRPLPIVGAWARRLPF